ncbi:hypothetical protein KHQ81_13025 [Mycoplasmatota bacterium]|nr:hypothetical protein KHQ81_13025 [Mycoplasmatota bacterium]
MEERENQVIKIYQQLIGIHDVENENYIELESDNITDLFTNTLISFKLYVEKLTSKEFDLIEFIGVLNKLAVQYLLENKEED